MQLSSNPRILVVPDGFKGTLTSQQVADAIVSGFREVLPAATFQSFPLADGGEGSSAIAAGVSGAKRQRARVCGPVGERVDSYFYLTPDGKAFVELAAASGLPLVSDPTKTAEVATTYGTGQLVRKAIEAGAREVYIFLGGSATTDGGVGIAKALGYEFHDASGHIIPSVTEHEGEFPGECLRDIASLSPPVEDRLRDAKITAVVDVDNPLCGANGAAYIHGPQKGAADDALERLDSGLHNLSVVTNRDLKCDFAEIPGAGAAGGSAFGVLSFLSGEMVRGPEFFLDLIDFDSQASAAALVITGEGKLDQQSLEGKLLSEILKRSQALNTPVLSIAGVVELNGEVPGLTAVGLTRADAMSNASFALYSVAREIARSLLRKS